MTHETLNNPHQFLGAYFNEEWMTEHKKADDVIHAFATESTSKAILGVQKDITLLLIINLNEDSLRKFLMKNMSCSYCYWHEWESGKIWLNHIFKFLNEGSISGILPNDKIAI
ncbi:contact-dependent growth inhibition system immunity protein [Pseudomonas sp. PB3P13]